MQQRQQSTVIYTAKDVNWIHISQENNLCERCSTETNNDPNKTLAKLE